MKIKSRQRLKSKMHVFCQLSNMLGVFPVWFCLTYKAYGLAAIIAAAVTLSILYHINEKNELALLADAIGCSLLVALVITCIRRSKVVFTFCNILTIVYTTAGITCYFLAGDNVESDQYKVYHSAWHIFCIYGLGTFLYSYFDTTYEEESRSKLLCKPLKPILIVKVLRRPRLKGEVVNVRKRWQIRKIENCRNRVA